MDREAALARLREITAGIDRDELEPPGDGWWETLGGAKFGAERLALLEALVVELAR